jgi:hypothetical protein
MFANELRQWMYEQTQRALNFMIAGRLFALKIINIS